jgi:hypothetical protein
LIAERQQGKGSTAGRGRHRARAEAVEDLLREAEK